MGSCACPSQVSNFYQRRENMGIRKDIHKVLIIGSGPIIIGQACVPE